MNWFYVYLFQTCCLNSHNIKELLQNKKKIVSKTWDLKGLFESPSLPTLKVYFNKI